MEEIIQFILYFHVFSGGVALLSGIGAIATKKGHKKHKLSGNIYFWAMLSVITTALFVGFYRNNIFLQTVAVFSFYMAFTGKRALRYKKEICPEPIDWTVNLIALSVAIFMIYLAIVNALKIGFRGVVPVLFVFGGILLAMALQDIVKLRKRNFIKNKWLLTHIGRMGGSFIATTTAFLLTNIHFNPGWVVWLAPTLLGTPIIIYSIRKWRIKMSPKKVIQ